jgi:glycosyltransferase involved in cell wall biosynthesis
MKISYFITHFPYKNKPFSKKYATGGAEAVADNLASVMAQKGHEISIFTTSPDSKDGVEEYNGIKVYRYGTNFRVASGSFSFGLLKNPAKYPTDLVHVHISVPMGDIAGLRCAKKKNVPLVITYHGEVQGGYGGFIRRISVYFYSKYLLNKILSYADVIISPSEYYINESRLLSRYRDKIVVIPNGVNIDEFNIPYSKEECREKLDLPLDVKIILFLSGLNPHKGPDVLVRAMPKILKKVSDAKLVFVGGGGMREELERLCKRLGIEKNVKFAGFVEENMKSFYYKAADVFCLPSVMKSEVFPIVLLEASASGLPMVVSDLDTFKCIIEDGYNGIVTKRGDEKNLADAIIYLLENKEVREKMGINGRKKVKDYSWERIAEMTEKIYLNLIGE